MLLGALSMLAGCASFIPIATELEETAFGRIKIVEALVFDYYAEQGEVPPSIGVLARWVNQTRQTADGNPIVLDVSSATTPAQAEDAEVYSFCLPNGVPWYYARLDEAHYLLYNMDGSDLYYGRGDVSLLLNQGPWEPREVRAYPVGYEGPKLKNTARRSSFTDPIARDE
jgi:hypothetical protein